MSSDESLRFDEDVDRRGFLRRTALAGATIPSVTALLAGLTACGSGDGTSSGNKLLGFAHPASTGAFYPPVYAGAVLEAKKRGWTVLESHAQLKLDKQVAEIQAWIAQGVDALTVAAIDLNAMAPLVKRAHAAGIAVVAYSNPIPGADASMVWGDPAAARLVGAAAGKWINEKLDGKAKVAFMGAYDIPVLATRLRGAKPALLETAPGADIVYEGKGGIASEAFDVTSSLLQRHPDLKVVICAADDGALGSSQAFLKAGVDVKDVWVAGYDGSKPALEKAITGTNPLRAVAALDLVSIGRHVVSIPDDFIKEKRAEKWVAPYTLVDGSNPEVGERFIRSFSQ
jgi:ribose transport system substrate-binding protein